MKTIEKTNARATFDRPCASSVPDFDGFVSKVTG